jgi:hypothetical protein
MLSLGYLIFGQSRKPNVKVSAEISISPTPVSESSVDIKSIEELKTSAEEMESYYRVYKNPFVIYLRKALNAYFAHDSSGVDIARVAVDKDEREGIISGLDSFDKSYYRSKFVVITINDSMAGGKDIQILFQDKPDRIFYAWVYQLATGEYELRGFNSKESFDPEAMKDMTNAYKDLIFDKEHSL